MNEEGEDKERDAKKLYLDYVRKAMAAEHERGQFDEDSTEAIRLRKREIQPAGSTAVWDGPRHYPPGPYKWYAPCHCRCHWHPHIWKGICWCCT